MNLKPNRSLLATGTLLVFLSLVLGLFLPLFTNPRMALSAHQVGITGGILIVLMGLAWDAAALRGRRGKLAESLLIAGPSGIALSCVAAAVFGTSRATPIAGAGFGGVPWQEVTISLGLGAFSIATLIALGVLLVGFLRNR